MQKKLEKIFFDFQIVAFEFVALNTCSYCQRYFSSGVNMLTNSLKVTDTMKTEFFELVSIQSDRKSDKYTAVEI